MWPNSSGHPRPYSDHYNNNLNGNPYSRNSNVRQLKPVQQRTDPWDWGWEDGSGQQDDWNNGWNQPPPPNVVPNPRPHYPTNSEQNALTPDLIPDKINNISRGNTMHVPQQNPFNHVPNASDFFENIDLNSQNYYQPAPPVYSSSDNSGAPQPLPTLYTSTDSSGHQNYPIFQNTLPQNTNNRLPSTVNYFDHTNAPQLDSSMPFYQQLPHPNNRVHTPSNQTLTQTYNYFSQTQPSATINQSSFSRGNLTDNQSMTREVENVEVPIPPTELATTLAFKPEQLHNVPQNREEIRPNRAKNVPRSEESNTPDNQETVPDNEEDLKDLSQKLNEMSLKNSYSLEMSNSSPGWDNKEVATRCELDRNQYLETGQLEEVPQGHETDNNDDVETLPPPGLHRMVTGQGTESLDQRSVIGQNSATGFSRLVTGHSNPRGVSDTTSLERTVLGQQNNDDDSRRTVIGQHDEYATHSKRMVPGQQNNEEVLSSSCVRSVPGQQIRQETPLISQRMVPGQQNNDENLINPQRIMPGSRNIEQIPNNSQRTVLGQQNSEEDASENNFVRTVPGQQSNDTISASSPRNVQGHHNNEEIPMGTSFRMIPGQYQNEEIPPGSSLSTIPRHQSQDFNMLQMQDSLGDLQFSQTQPDAPLSARAVPGQQSEHNRSADTNNMERMIPGGLSDHENSFSAIGLDDERMVPGGMSDDSLSQSLSMDEEARNSTERMIPGMKGSAEASSGRGADQHLSSPDGGRHSRDGTATQPQPRLTRLVLGRVNADVTTNKDQTSSVEHLDEIPASNPSKAMKRMVVGQFREKAPVLDNEKDKETIKSNDRNDDSDSDFRSERRQHRHRKDTYEDDRKDRDYSSERDYRRDGSRREDRREYRKKRDPVYNRSPEYRSDHDDYDRSDYRDRRDRDRRDLRPKERDRRRRSPDYSYDCYYRDDPRKLPPRERDRRYYDYEDDPYYYRENRSRPSSRSGSEYRRHKDYPTRSQYYPDAGNYTQYYQMQQYYENMRRVDPQGYAIWYEQYMAGKYGSTSTDRASVHSGRSSANDTSRLIENEEEEREEIKADDVTSHRSTPPLYNSAHIRGKFNSLGQLIVINPQDPFSREDRAMVCLCKVDEVDITDDPDVVEFLQNPGPFISGMTHKNTVLQYLKKHSNSCHSSEKLLYELIRLVIKLNGVVDMTDVAELLMESYHSSTNESDNFHELNPETEDPNPLSPQQITSKFRNLLLEGNKTEALEWAMKNKDWGHALFLASKMDSRTHNNVMLRFANGLQINDPLQTLYQLMSGHEPQAVTCAADKNWGDWRPHLAMMLSNRTTNIELDRKAILTLGDSLGGRGRIFAAHFCYLTAQLEFSNYSDRHAKLVLLGISPDRSLKTFASCRAIMLTLCYEYAKQLSLKEWCIPTLRPYKFLLACRLYDHGKIMASLAYLEALAQDIVRLPRRDDGPLIQLIVDMAEKIKCADTTLAFTADPTGDPDWLATLKSHFEKTSDPSYLNSQMIHGVSTSTVSEMDPISGAEHVPQSVPQEMTQEYYSEEHSYQTGPHVSMTYSQQQDPYIYYNPQQLLIPTVEDNQQSSVGCVTEHTQVYNGGASHWAAAPVTTHWSHQQLTDSSDTAEQLQQPVGSSAAEIPDPPQISVKSGFGYFTNSDENPNSQAVKPTVPPPEKREKKDKPNNKTQQSGSGWFGGIWDKLALKPKNQMKLPDDKNPSIVWDDKTKRWVNTDTAAEAQSALLKPPPMVSEPASFTPTPGPNNPILPPLTTSGNKYKLQKGKGMRGNYVDVFGPQKMQSAPSANANGAIPGVPVTTNFFVPATVAGNECGLVDFVSPSGPVSCEPSSFKGEEQPPPGGYGNGPVFFNPTSYQQ